MSNVERVAESIRAAYFINEKRSMIVAWRNLPEHRRQKWLAMANAAISVNLEEDDK